MIPGHHTTLPDTSPRELREQNHTLDVVVLQEMDVGSHVRDGANIDHHHVVNLGEPLLVKPAGQHHLGGRYFCNQRGQYKYKYILNYILLIKDCI